MYIDDFFCISNPLQQYQISNFEFDFVGFKPIINDNGCRPIKRKSETDPGSVSPQTRLIPGSDVGNGTDPRYGIILKYFLEIRKNIFWKSEKIFFGNQKAILPAFRHKPD